MDMEGIQFLAVTSNFDKKFKGKFHGVAYEWKPGATVNMPVEAAAHIFGFGEEDKTRALHRAGFLSTVDDMDAAMEKLGKFSFAPVEQVFEIAGTRARRARKRAGATIDQISDDRSPVSAVGLEGAAERPAPEDPDDDGADEDDDDDEAGAGAR